MEENNPQDFDFSTKVLKKEASSTDKPEDEENKEDKKDEKPKYDKKNDFFDTLTNSTLEPRDMTRGGRGRGRGGFSDRGRGDFRGGRGGRGGWNNDGNRGGFGDDNNRGNFRGRRGGGYGNGDPFHDTRGGYNNYRGRGRGGYDRDSNTFERRPNTAKKELYSDTLKDPNAQIYKDNEAENSGKTKDPFFDNMRSDNKGYRDNFNKRGDFRGGYRGGHQHYDSERGRGGHYGSERGRGGFRGRPQTAANNDKRDEETFGAASSQNFKFKHENIARGGQKIKGSNQQND